jgi:hypothetical protein
MLRASVVVDPVLENLEDCLRRRIGRLWNLVCAGFEVTLLPGQDLRDDSATVSVHMMYINFVYHSLLQ